MRVKGFQADHYGCGYYRMELPSKAFRQAGIEWKNQDNIGKDDFNADYDIVVLQRQYLSKPLVGYFNARKQGATMIYELDDWVWNIDKSNPVKEEYANPEVRANIERYMCLVDAVTVSTNYLGKMIERWIEPERIFTLPNCLDFEMWNKHLAYREENKKSDGLIRIGWHGSSTHLLDFNAVVKPLTRLLKEYKKLRLVIGGWEVFDYLPELKKHMNQIEFWPWGTPEEFGKNNANVDIGIAPLIYTEFNRCKSAIKHYEYSALKIPTIATWIEPYMEVKARGGITIEGNHEGQWYNAMKSLIDNKAKRIAMGEEAYKHVTLNNDISTAFERWVVAFEMAKEIRKERKVELYIGKDDNDPDRKLVDVA